MSGPRGQFGTPVKQKEGSKYRRLEKKKKKKTNYAYQGVASMLKNTNDLSALLRRNHNEI